MRKLALAFAIIFAVTISVSAQGIKPELRSSVYAITNNPNGTHDVGVGIGGVVHINRLHLGLDVAGDLSKNNPKQLTRGRAYATYSLFTVYGVDVRAGGGAGKTGNEVFGFGRIEADYRKLKAFVLVGSQSAVETEAAYYLFSLEHFAVGPYYRFTDLRGLQPLHQAGVQFVLR